MPWPLPSYAFDIHAELKFKEFEMFEAGSQDFCSVPGPHKPLGFIEFCAVQYDFLSARAIDSLALRQQRQQCRRRFAELLKRYVLISGK
jgi:hypothetical protein